jgi:hypothetical protein
MALYLFLDPHLKWYAEKQHGKEDQGIEIPGMARNAPGNV